MPFIIGITGDFKSAAASAFEINVKVDYQDIKCPCESVALSDMAVTFPSIASTGDCMGDDLQGLMRGVSSIPSMSTRMAH